MPIEWVIPAVALVLLVWAYFIHRRLMGLRQVAAEAWAETELLFRKRHELVSRLVEKAQGALGPDSRSTRNVANARKVAATARDPVTIGKAEAALALAIEGLLTRAGGHPDLKANDDFLALQKRFPALDEEIRESRDYFNEAVDDYNQARRSVLGTLLGYAVKLPLLEPLPVPKPAEPAQERAILRY